MKLPETVKTLKETIEAYLSEIYQDKHADTVAYEITEIIEKWLEQKKQYYEAQKELGADYWLYTHRQRVVDDLLKELER